MRWFVFEDSAAGDLAPIALARPVFELICGREGLRRRLQRWFPASDWGALVRPYLAETYDEQHPDASVNRLSFLHEGITLIVNGRWVPQGRLTEQEVTLNNAGFIDGHLAWIAVSPDEARVLGDVDFSDVLHGIASNRRAIDASGFLAARPWDLVNANSKQLILDFEDEGVSQPPQQPHVQTIGPAQDVYISAEARIDPYVVFDTTDGPVSVDRGVHIQSFTRIAGPCHIGADSRVFRALISGGTTIGRQCRAGGEIEASILHAYVNKYHEGFLGHSYVCPWVNLGAITTTSDLKSDYSNVRVPLQGDFVDSETAKVGSFIGDHTKTAIDSMFNTGTSVGVMGLVLPGGRLLPRHIPSFCNVSFGELAADWPLDTSIETARVAMARRNETLTPAAERLFRTLHQQTTNEREVAMALASQKRLRQQ